MTRPALSTLLLLLLLATVFSPLAQAQSYYPFANLTILDAAGDGDCVNVGGVATNCTLPFTLNLTVAYLPLPIPTDPYALEVTLNYESYFRVDLYSAAYTPTSIAFLVSSYTYWWPGGTPLGLSLIWDVSNGTTRARQVWGPTPAFSLQPWVYPDVYSVTGCQPSNSALMTTNCVPEQDVLTVTGVSFSQVTSLQLVISGEGLTTRFSTIYWTYTTGAALLNDSCATIALTDNLGFLLLAEHYSGQQLQLQLVGAAPTTWQATPFFITMAFLPAPLVTRYSSLGQPTVVTNTTAGSFLTYTNCIPGITALQIQGRYLFDVTVTVGGFVCDTSSRYGYAYPTQLVCILDDGDVLTPNLPYDVVITTDEGRTVIPQAVAFTSQSTLASVLPCWDDGGFWTFGITVARCMPGDTLNIVGRRLLQSGLQLDRVYFETYYSPPTPYLNCSDSQVVSDTLIACTMPPNTLAYYIMTNAKVISQWGPYTANMLAIWPYDYIDAPRILSIQGCGMTASDPQRLFLTSCNPGDRLQLSGYNLNVSLGGAAVRSIRSSSTGFGQFACSDVQVWSDANVTCTLPTLQQFPQLQNMSQYNLTLYRAQGGPSDFSSNYFAVTFGQPSPANQSSTVVNLTILSAAGDGSCINVGGVALNCSLPFTLNLTVVNVPLPVPLYALSLQLNTSAYFQSQPVDPMYTATSVSFLVSSIPYNLPGATLLSLSLIWAETNGTGVRITQQWGPTPVFSLQPWVYPDVYSVRGCQPSDSALLTTNCVPEQDVLTVTGVSFSTVSSLQLVVSGANVSTQTRYIYLGFTKGAAVLNDSTLSIATTDSLGFLLLAEHYSGQQLQLQLIATAPSIWQATPFFITMAFLPPPLVTRYSSFGQPTVLTNTTAGTFLTYTNCIPGITTLQIEGRYLFDVTVTVGGFLCSINPDWGYAFPTELVCVLDDGDVLTPNLPYDVVITTDEGRTVIPQAVSFTSQSTLARLLPCWDDGGFYPGYAFPVPRCMAGDTLSVVGRRLMQGGLQLDRIYFETYYSPPAPYLNCSNSLVVSDTLITCTMPPNSNVDYIQRNALVRSQWGTYSSNTFATHPYDYLNAPRILAIQGCGMTATNPQQLFLTSCQPGDLLHLSGYNLSVVGGTDIRSIPHPSTNFAQFPCSNVTVLSNTNVTCTLPTLQQFPQLQNLSQYNLTLCQAQGGPSDFSSNYFAVTFSDAPPQVVPEESSEGSNSRIVAVVVSVVVVVTVLLLAAAAGWWVWKKDGKLRCWEAAEEEHSLAPDSFVHSSSHRLTSMIELEHK